VNRPEMATLAATSPPAGRDDVVLHLGDCRVVMAGMEAGSVDAIVTDPPYGIGYRPSGGDGNAPRGLFAPMRGDEGPFDPSHLLGMAPIIILFGANHYADKLPPSPFWLVWDKREDGNSNDMADCEVAWCNVKSPARLFSHRWMGMIRASERKRPRVHPTQKPVALMKWAMDAARIPVGATVLDPYMGSGTTGVACLKTGRRFIGIESDPTYFAIARRRLDEARTPLLDAMEGQPA
jgi:site-specific DNA-methyltransferase (adenine-specific)